VPNQAEHEGFRMLDDFICDAIHEPGVSQADPKKQGKNEGIQVLKELTFGAECGIKIEAKAKEGASWCSDMAEFDATNPDAARNMRQMFGPGQLDGQIRQAIQICWMMLPEDRKTVDELEKQIRRIVDRAFQDFREDSEAFGLG
jgi:hypothetical protein